MQQAQSLAVLTDLITDLISHTILIITGIHLSRPCASIRGRQNGYESGTARLRMGWGLAGAIDEPRSLARCEAPRKF